MIGGGLAGGALLHHVMSHGGSLDNAAGAAIGPVGGEQEKPPITDNHPQKETPAPRVEPQTKVIEKHYYHEAQPRGELVGTPNGYRRILPAPGVQAQMYGDGQPGYSDVPFNRIHPRIHDVTGMSRFYPGAGYYYPRWRG